MTVHATPRPPSTTLRLLMPQWQGGNNGIPYPLGARLLAWLAPDSDAPLVEVPVEPYSGAAPAVEGGVVGRSVLLRQLRAARDIIAAYRPEHIVVFGGDCLVSQAPSSYLNQRYGGELGVLWIDAHPDVTTPADFAHEHAMVLGNLLGEGDPEFAREVPVPLRPERVLYAGVDETLPYETAVLDRLRLAAVGSDALAPGSAPVAAWIRDQGITRLAVHLDLDVLDPGCFRSLLFTNPDPAVPPVDAAHGKLTFPQLATLLADVSALSDVVGLTIAEHMPWDAINLQTLMSRLPIMR